LIDVLKFLFFNHTCNTLCFLFLFQASDNGLHPPSPPAHLFHVGEQIQVIADTTPGVESRYSVGIGCAVIVELGEESSKVRVCGGMDRNCVTTYESRSSINKLLKSYILFLIPNISLIN
jgi:hypothetical protein